MWSLILHPVSPFNPVTASTATAAVSLQQIETHVAISCAYKSPLSYYLTLFCSYLSFFGYKALLSSIINHQYDLRERETR